MAAANVAGTKEDFMRGHDDAYYRRGYRPTTVRYVDGYESGLKLREILCPSEKEQLCLMRL